MAGWLATSWSEIVWLRSRYPRGCAALCKLSLTQQENMSSEWQVVDTLQKKKEKLKQKHAENAIENAAKEKKRVEVCVTSPHLSASN